MGRNRGFSKRKKVKSGFNLFLESLLFSIQQQVFVSKLASSTYQQLHPSQRRTSTLANTLHTSAFICGRYHETTTGKPLKRTSWRQLGSSIKIHTYLQEKKRNPTPVQLYSYLKSRSKSQGCQQKKMSCFFLLPMPKAILCIKKQREMCINPCWLLLDLTTTLILLQQHFHYRTAPYLRMCISPHNLQSPQETPKSIHFYRFITRNSSFL